MVASSIGINDGTLGLAMNLWDKAVAQKAKCSIFPNRLNRWKSPVLRRQGRAPWHWIGLERLHIACGRKLGLHFCGVFCSGNNLPSPVDYGDGFSQLCFTGTFPVYSSCCSPSTPTPCTGFAIVLGACPSGRGIMKVMQSCRSGWWKITGSRQSVPDTGAKLMVRSGDLFSFSSFFSIWETRVYGKLD